MFTDLIISNVNFDATPNPFNEIFLYSHSELCNEIDRVFAIHIMKQQEGYRRIEKKLYTGIKKLFK